MSMADWRAVAGRVSATYSTPLPTVLQWPWDETILWWHEASDIDRERWAPLRKLADAMTAREEEE